VYRILGLPLALALTVKPQFFPHQPVSHEPPLLPSREGLKATLPARAQKALARGGCVQCEVPMAGQKHTHPGCQSNLQ